MADQGLYVRGSTSDIATPVANGSWLFNLTNGQIYVFNGTAWVVTSGGGGGSAPPITTLNGTTGGAIYWAQNVNTRKTLTASLSGYENDTSTAQTITYPVPYLYLPYIMVTTDASGLVVTSTLTTLTIAAGTSAVFNGLIDVVGL